MTWVIKEVNEDMFDNTRQFSGLLTRFSTKLYPFVGRGSGLDDVIFVCMEIAVSAEDAEPIIDRLAACLATEEVIGTTVFSLTAREAKKRPRKLPKPQVTTHKKNSVGTSVLFRKWLKRVLTGGAYDEWGL